jgi:drug/metabolite transporter (DMT)-like permease
MLTYVLAVLAPLLASVGQILLKRAAVRGGRLLGAPRYTLELLLGAVLFGTSAVAGVLCMRVLEFSAFYSMTALSYVFIAVLAHFHLRERFDRAKVAGSIITIAGVFIYNWGG